MIPQRDYIQVMKLAFEVHAIVFWHTTSVGDYQPVLLPVPDNVWRQIIS